MTAAEIARLHSLDRMCHDGMRSEITVGEKRSLLTALEQSRAALAEAGARIKELEAELASSKRLENDWHDLVQKQQLEIMKHPSELQVLRARLETAKEALKPFSRADAAIGEARGPFRFETGTGYRELYREDFRRARAAIAEMEK